MAFRAGIAAYIDARDAKRGAEEFNRSIGQMVADARAGTARIGTSFGGLKSQILGLAAQLGVAVGGAELLRGIIDTAASFDHLRKNLETATGSATSAARAFDYIKAFADDAPGSIEDVTQAYIKLVQLGIDPTAGALEALGNLAVVRNQNIAQAADTAVGAALGRAMQLKELGIVAEESGKKLILTFGTARVEVDRNVSSMINGVIRLANGVKGAMARSDDSVTGAFGDIGLAFRNFADEVGKSGVNDALKDFAKNIKESVQGATSFADAVGSTLASAIRGAGDAFAFARDHADEFRLIFEALIAREAILRIGQYGAVLIELAGTFRTLAAAQGAWAAVAAIANPALILPAVIAGGTAALLYAQRQADERMAQARAMAAPGIADIMSNAPVTSGPRTLGVSDITTVADIAREKTQRDATLAAQATAEAAAAQAEADKKAREAAEQAAKEAAKAEQTRQANIAETLRMLESEATLQQQITNAIKGQSGLAEAQATGNVAVVDAITEATRRLAVEQDTLKTAQGAGIQATVDQAGAATALNRAEQPLIDNYREQIDLASQAAEAAKKYGDAHDFVRTAIENALTPAEKYSVALENIRREFALNAQGQPLSPLEMRAFDQAQIDAQKAALEDWRQKVAESENVSDIGDKLFAGFDAKSRQFANDLTQYGIATVDEFAQSIIDMQQNGVKSFGEFATRAVQELERIVLQAMLTKAALGALSFFGFGASAPTSTTGTAPIAGPGSLGSTTLDFPTTGSFTVPAQPADTASIALKSDRLRASSQQSMKFDVNVVNSPSQEAPRVQVTQTPQGVQLDLIYEGFVNRLNRDTLKGGGTMPALRALGVDPGRQLVR